MIRMLIKNNKNITELPNNVYANSSNIKERIVNTIEKEKTCFFIFFL